MGQSIGKLFVGTLVPSAILTIMMIIMTGVICRLYPEWGPRGEKTTLLEKLKVIPTVLEIPILFGVIMTALLSGMVTATEAAPLSCFLGLVICLIRRRLSWKKFVSAVHDTLRVACMIFMIVAGAMLFGRLMTATGVPNEVAEWIAGVGWPNWVVLTLIIMFYIVGGCLMDALAFLLASLPIFFPIVVGTMQFDPIWFGVLICLVTTLGAITPPIGICCYVIAGMSKEISIKQVFKGALCYVPAYIVTIVIMIIFKDWTVNFLAGFAR
jgi:tripartite ATP-independent transporter DctM subunit